MKVLAFTKTAETKATPYGTCGTEKYYFSNPNNFNQ